MMLDIWLKALAAILVFGVAGWLFSIPRRDVSFVDGMWSLMFLIAAAVYATSELAGTRATLVLVLVAVWALRLSGHILIRNWGEGEDFRYQKIRANNEPNFAFKSLYIVFGLQGALAAFISLPLLGAIASDAPLGVLDLLGVLLWLTGFIFESVGDQQLTAFRRNPDNAGKVLNKGLWALTRHPNYFGDACVWWGFYLIAVSAGGWWTILSPLLMSFLLLRVSGVALLERDIGNRRPDYAHYVATTNAFFPGPKKNVGDAA